MKFSAKRLILIAVIVVAVLGVSLAAFGFWPGNVTREQAREVVFAYEFEGARLGDGAVSRRPGRDLLFENGLRRAWSVEVYYAGFVYEVYVSRFSGEVLRVEVDRWD